MHLLCDGPHAHILLLENTQIDSSIGLPLLLV